MSVNVTILIIILGCAVVTIIPRITPFILVRNMKLPATFIKWLSFIPVCIFTALIVDSFIIQEAGMIAIDWLVLLAILPTLAVAIWTKSLALTVIVGVITMAVVRFLL